MQRISHAELPVGIDFEFLAFNVVIKEQPNTVNKRTSRTTRTSRRSVWRAFNAGLMRASGTSMVVAFAVATAVIIFCSSEIDEEWVIRNGRLFVRGIEDVHGQVTQRALELKVSGSKQPAVVLLGDTVASEVSSRAHLKASLVNTDDVKVYDLRTSAQTLWEALALSDQIPRHATGAVLLQLSPASFAKPCSAG